MATYERYPRGYQFFRNTGDGVPLAGGKLKYERAGTSVLLTTYSDPNGTTPNTQVNNRIVLDAFGRLSEPVYIDNAWDAKETLYDANDVIVAPWPQDNIPRAVDLTPAQLGSAKPLIEWIAITAAQSPYNLAAANVGKGVAVNASGGPVTINLPIAANLPNGSTVVIKKTAGANAVTVDPHATETVDGQLTLTITKINRSVALVTDGANWLVASERMQDLTAQEDFEELSATPAAPGVNRVRLYAIEVGGATQLAMRRENGPQEIVAREGLSPGALLCIIEDQKSQGTPGGTFASGADRVRDLNTLVFNRGSLVTLASNQFTLPAGTWEIEWSMPAHSVDSFQSLLWSATDSAVVARGSAELARNASGARHTTRSVGSVVVTLSASKNFEIRGRGSNSQTTDGFGAPANFGTEVYTRVVIRYA